MFALPAILFSKLSLLNSAITTVAGRAAANESKSNCSHNRASNINNYSRVEKGYGDGNVEENCNKKQFVLLFIISIKLSRHRFVCVWESWRKCECACKQCGMQREQVLAKGTERVKV